MQETVKRKATYADLEVAPPRLVAEILRGQLVTHPRPSGDHGSAHFRLASILGSHFGEGLGGPGGWEFVIEPELHLGAEVAVPEIAGWRLETIHAASGADPLAPVKIRLVPDWVCEILSPSTEKYDRGDKRDIYAEAGIGYLWLVDPRIHVLEVFALSAGAWKLVRTWTDDEAVQAEPFAPFKFELGRVWPRQYPTPREEA